MGKGRHCGRDREGREAGGEGGRGILQWQNASVQVCRQAQCSVKRQKGGQV